MENNFNLKVQKDIHLTLEERIVYKSILKTINTTEKKYKKIYNDADSYLKNTKCIISKRYDCNLDKRYKRYSEMQKTIINAFKK